MIASINRQLLKPSFGRSSNRLGFTLIEVLVLISVSSILLTVVALWLHKLLLFSSTLMERQRDHINLNRLATELRQDVMFAKSWSFPNPKEPSHLELTMVDGSKIQYQLEYEAHGSKIHAVHLPAPVAKATDEKELLAEVAKTFARREIYRFSPSCRLNWDRDQLPQSLALIAYRVPMLANPLPKRIADSKTAPNPQVVSKVQHDSSGQFSAAAVETCIRLTPNRWAGRIHRALEDSP